MVPHVYNSNLLRDWGKRTRRSRPAWIFTVSWEAAWNTWDFVSRTQRPEVVLFNPKYYTVHLGEWERENAVPRTEQMKASQAFKSFPRTPVGCHCLIHSQVMGRTTCSQTISTQKLERRGVTWNKHYLERRTRDTHLRAWGSLQTQCWPCQWVSSEGQISNTSWQGLWNSLHWLMSKLSMWQS